MEYINREKYYFSKLSLGTVQLGIDYGISNADGKASPEVAQSILDTAFRAGINTVDTSESYGSAERLIGDFLAPNATQYPINVVTKFKINKPASYATDHLRNEISRSLQSSLKNLGLKKIPIYLFHAGKDDQLAKLIEPLSVIFQELRDQGFIDIAGISAYSPEDVDFVLEHDVVEAVQLPINIFDHRLINDGRLEKLEKHNKIVFARSIFLQGLVLMSTVELPGNLHEAEPFLLELEHLSKEAGRSIAELAFAFVNELKAVTSIVFGAVNIDQVRENVALLQTPSLAPGIRELVMKTFANVPERIVTPGLW